MKKLFILDGSGYLYRAYYAFPEIIDKHGQNVNVVYGFFRMIIKVLEDKPDYLLIARDAPQKTYRHMGYPEYKANRAKAPDDFKAQIPLVQHIVEKVNIASLISPGYEADDIIASVVSQLQNQESLDIFIHSSDKDLKQLINNQVHIIDPIKNKQIKTKEFLQEFMFEPKYMLDYLALTGDSSDNIKGVEGVGPKTASTLIKKYNSIDEIYRNLDNIPENVRNKLIQGKSSAHQSKQLISLQDVPELIGIDVSEYISNFDLELYQKVLVQDHEFTSLQKSLQNLQNKLLTPQQNSLF